MMGSKTAERLAALNWTTKHSTLRIVQRDREGELSHVSSASRSSSQKKSNMSPISSSETSPTSRLADKDIFLVTKQ